MRPAENRALRASMPASPFCLGVFVSRLTLTHSVLFKENDGRTRWEGEGGRRDAQEEKDEDKMCK